MLNERSSKCFINRRKEIRDFPIGQEVLARNVWVKLHGEKGNSSIVMDV